MRSHFGILVHETNALLCRWKYTRSVVLDGNFSAQHRKMRRPEDDVALADGHAFMVTDGPYKEHLKTAAEYREVSSPCVITECT